jgi:quercetin dioxygenase-like cupin family protein
MDIIRTRPKSQPGPSEWFVGSVWIDRIAVATAPARLRAFSVHFSPGARTAWHRHPFGQILHVTEGVGRVQRWGEPVREIRAGDTVWTEPNEWHWHGAAPDRFMTHLAMQESESDGTDVYWDEHVGDAEYRAAPDEGAA